MSSKINLVLLGFVVGFLVGGGSAKADFISGIPAEIGTQARGTLVAWGLNDDGQCNVPRGNDFVAISGGHWHSLALRARLCIGPADIATKSFPGGTSVSCPQDTNDPSALIATL